MSALLDVVCQLSLLSSQSLLLKVTVGSTVQLIFESLIRQRNSTGSVLDCNVSAVCLSGLDGLVR